MKRSQSSHPGTVYEIQPGYAEGWERVVLEQRPEGVRVIVNMGHVEYVMIPTAFVLEGLLETARRVARGEIPNATLGPIGQRALEIMARAVRIAA